MAYRMGFGNLKGFGSYRMRGLGATLDCSAPDPGPPPPPNYADCAPTDSMCVAANTRLNAQYAVDVQAYHDAQAACSAQKFAASGGTITPSAFTYGAGVDFTTGNIFTAPVASQTLYDAEFQPFQSGAQAAATEKAVLQAQAVPLMFTPPTNPANSTPPPAQVTNAPVAPPPNTTVSSAVPPATQNQQPGISLPAGVPSSIGGISLSSIPWWGWLALVGGGAWALSKS